MRPFSPTQLKNLQQRFRIAYIHHTNGLEGNTLTLSEVKILLEDGITIGGKTVAELKETLNHGALLSKLHELISDHKPQHITISYIKKLHHDLMEGILQNHECGTWRTINVMISGSVDEFPHPNEVAARMKTFEKNPLSKTKYTLEDIARIHYDFVKIHPFVDGNGRIARLIMNIALIQSGYFPIIIPKILRKEYLESLSGDNFEKFYEFFCRQMVENLKDYVRFFSN